MSVDELENAITKLSPTDMARFAQWFDEYRALAKERAEGLVWFWIGPHDQYEQMLHS